MRVKHYDFSKIESSLQKKLLQGSVVPRPIAWVTSIGEEGLVNVAPFSYFSVISHSLVTLSIQTRDKQHKDTYRNILNQKEAVIHIVDESLLEVMDESAQNYPPDISEVETLNLALKPSQKVEVPSLEKPKISIEVTLLDEIECKNENDIEANLLILKVVNLTISEAVFDCEKEYILIDKLKPVARLAGPQYGKVGLIDYQRKY